MLRGAMAEQRVLVMQKARPPISDKGTDAGRIERIRYALGGFDPPEACTPCGDGDVQTLRGSSRVRAVVFERGDVGRAWPSLQNETAWFDADEEDS